MCVMQMLIAMVRLMMVTVIGDFDGMVDFGEAKVSQMAMMAMMVMMVMMVVMVVMVVVRVMSVSLCCTTTRPGVSALTVSSSRPFYLYLCLSPSPVSQYAAVTLQPTGFFTGSKRAAPAGPCGY